MFCKFFLVSLLCAAAIKADLLVVKNGNSNDLVVSITGQSDVTVASKQAATLILDDNWSGTITALPVDAEVIDGPKTTIELSLGTDADSYDISLVNGFNLGAKIIPTGTSAACEAAVCLANLRALCPVENQVTNTVGTVVACENSPIIMSTVCPTAVVTSSDTLNIKSCNSTSYLVLIR